MSGMTAAELARQQSVVQSSMPETWSLLRVTRVRQDDGSWSETFAAVDSGAEATSDGGRLMPAGTQAMERTVGARFASLGDWIAALPADTTPRTADRLVIAGRTFEIVGVGAPHTWTARVMVALTEVT